MSKTISGCAEFEAWVNRNATKEFCCVDDILAIDGSLSEAQARRVLRRLEKQHVSATASSWEVIEATIEEMRCEGEL